MDVALTKILKNIDTLIAENNMTAKMLTEKMGMRKGIITDWRKGRSKPTFDSIVVISTIFNVSIDYLFTNDKYKTSSNKVLTVEEALLIKYFQKLSVIEQGKLLGNLEMKINKESEFFPNKEGELSCSNDEIA